jgi:ketosteroid isomerase-like protein
MEADRSTLNLFMAAVNARDGSLVRELLAPDVVLAPLLAHLREPATPYRGLDGAEAFFSDLNDLPNPPIVMPSQLLSAPTGTIVLATLRTRGDDGPVDHPVSLVFRLRNGRIASMQTYGSVATARTALGL